MDWSEVARRIEKLSEPHESGCRQWVGATASGYGRLRFGGKLFQAHRLAVGVRDKAMPDAGMDVCHTCDNRLCVNHEHLFIGTRKDNMQDCAKKKRLAIHRGIKLKCMFSSPEELAVLRLALQQAGSASGAARLLGCSTTPIKKAVARNGIATFRTGVGRTVRFKDAS